VGEVLRRLWEMQRYDLVWKGCLMALQTNFVVRVLRIDFMLEATNEC
jgi:hypothetical protein